MPPTEFPGLAWLRRRALVRRLALLGGLLVLLLGSALLWPRQQTGALTVPTTAAEPTASGVVRGTLAASRQGDRVCFRVATEDGAALLVLPDGWSADEQRSLLDRSGSSVAQPGDTVLVTGAPGAIGAVPGCAGEGRVWSVATVALR